MEKRADLVLGATTGFFGAESLDVAYNWDGWIMSIYGISENLYRLDENIEPLAMDRRIGRDTG